THNSCKGSVDTPHTGVDIMLQALRQKMKKWSSGVDTRSSSVDTRPSSQRTLSTGLDSVSTLDQMVSTLDASPRSVFESCTQELHRLPSSIPSVSPSSLFSIISASMAPMVDELEAMKHLSAHIDSEMSSLKKELRSINKNGIASSSSSGAQPSSSDLSAF
ncbi:hypothetical protein Taro_045961, partial [Colocasia esculenta]|nr:hypothetical protein [Colocasia esculenta]